MDHAAAVLPDRDAIEDLFWNNFTGVSSDFRCLIHIEQQDKIVVSYNRHSKTFSANNYNNIEYFVNSLTDNINEIEIRGRLNRLPEWRLFIKFIVDLLPADGKLFCQVDSAEYLSSSATDYSDTSITEGATNFIPFLHSLKIELYDVYNFMDVQEPGFITTLCQSTDIDYNGWRKIVSWIGENSDLTELYLLLNLHFFSSLDAKYVNTTWIAIRKNNNESSKHKSGLNSALQESKAKKVILEKHFPEEFLNRLNELLVHIPCAVFWYRLSSFYHFKYGEDINHLLNDTNKKRQSSWMQETIHDERVDELVKTWHQLPAVSQFLEFKGVNLGQCIEYDLMKDTLARADQIIRAK